MFSLEFNLKGYCMASTVIPFFYHLSLFLDNFQDILNEQTTIFMEEFTSLPSMHLEAKILYAKDYIKLYQVTLINFEFLFFLSIYHA